MFFARNQWHIQQSSAQTELGWKLRRSYQEEKSLESRILLKNAR